MFNDIIEGIKEGIAKSDAEWQAKKNCTKGSC